MMHDLPSLISIIFILTSLATLLLFFETVRKSKLEATRKKAIPILVGLVLWLGIQAVLTLANLYNTKTDVLPPKIVVFGILPTVLTLVFLFSTSKGKRFIDSLPLLPLTLIHLVRIPVEVVLYWLFTQQAIPELMTFEGRNFDILAGITAPLVAYFGLVKSQISRRVILIWNFVCLGLLLNIVVNALLSAPSPLQKFAFDQPNVAILYFPFSWLPTFVVPIVLFAHLASIRNGYNKKVVSLLCDQQKDVSA